MTTRSSSTLRGGRRGRRCGPCLPTPLRPGTPRGQLQLRGTRRGSRAAARRGAVAQSPLLPAYSVSGCRERAVDARRTLFFTSSSQSSNSSTLARLRSAGHCRPLSPHRAGRLPDGLSLARWRRFETRDALPVAGFFTGCLAQRLIDSGDRLAYSTVARSIKSSEPFGVKCLSEIGYRICRELTLVFLPQVEGRHESGLLDRGAALRRNAIINHDGYRELVSLAVPPCFASRRPNCFKAANTIIPELLLGE